MLVSATLTGDGACSLQYQGTLKVEVPLASGVSGVVTRDAKGSGQGTITITDGNSLDMPADVRFPKARASEPEGTRGTCDRLSSCFANLLRIFLSCWA